MYRHRHPSTWRRGHREPSMRVSVKVPRTPEQLVMTPHDDLFAVTLIYGKSV